MRQSEWIARLLVGVTVLTAISVPFMLRARTPLIHARMPEAGGWSVDVLRTEVGVPLHLRLISDDVMHGFAVGKLDAAPVDVIPGKITDVELRFEQPGTYTFYCTRWCGLNHWRMRGTIEVTGESARRALPEQPLYVAMNLDLDAPRGAYPLPSATPVAALAADQLESRLAAYVSTEYYRSHSPSETWNDLRADPAFGALDSAELWGVTAWIWRSNTTPQAVAAGRRLFSENCVACHGQNARGDGVFADDLIAAGSAAGGFQMATGDAGMVMQAPADLSDPVRMLAASPALLQGKILRGGMGTGMPSWGAIFTEEQSWYLVDYLYALQFEYP